MATIQVASVIDTTKCSEQGRLFLSEACGTTSDNAHDNFLVVKMSAHRIVEAMPDTTNDNYDERIESAEKSARIDENGIFITVP